MGDRLFYRCHQGYLVNLDYVERVQEDSLVLNEKVTIPVSKSKKEELLKKWQNMWHISYKHSKHKKDVLYNVY